MQTPVETTARLESASDGVSVMNVVQRLAMMRSTSTASADQGLLPRWPLRESIFSIRAGRFIHHAVIEFVCCWRQLKKTDSPAPTHATVGLYTVKISYPRIFLAMALALHYSVDLRIQTYTSPVLLKYGKLAKNIRGYVDILYSVPDIAGRPSFASIDIFQPLIVGNVSPILPP